MSSIMYVNGRSYTLKPLMDEQIDQTYRRLWIIIQHNPRNEYECERLIDISKLWYYKNKYNCRYSDRNEQIIRLFDSPGITHNCTAIANVSNNH